MAWRFIKEFIRLESFSGILLCTTALLGFIFANSPLHPIYNALLYHPIALTIFNQHWQTTFNLIINDGLMVLFFLLVGLEIKREILIGELNSKRKIALPGIAALGGMLVPAFVYLLITRHHSEWWQGWAIPTATDIAFALGVLRLLGNRVPLSLKIFLTALAIFDDVGAIIIIALFYTHTLHGYFLLYAAVIFAALIALNRCGIRQRWPYYLLGILLWLCVLYSGVHATIAGVLLAFCIPLDANKKPEPHFSMLEKVEQGLHPWVAFLILPLFALANTGIPLTEFSFHTLIHPLPLGIVLALFLGKQLGVFSAIFAAIKFKLSPMPSHSTWGKLYGVALLCGIGFTMSLFITTLAFTDATTLFLARAGILLGSLLSGLCGYILLRFY